MAGNSEQVRTNKKAGGQPTVQYQETLRDRTDATTALVNQVHRERPILMSTPMVRAILENRKTQTRRVIVPQPEVGLSIGSYATDGKPEATEFVLVDDDGDPVDAKCPQPRYQVGDHLWVRETFKTFRGNSAPDDDAFKKFMERGIPVNEAGLKEFSQLPYGHGDLKVMYAADYGKWAFDVDSDLKPWKPSIFMPRWASRLTLEVTEVRAQRVQEITEEDAIAEGTPNRLSFSLLWDTINKARGYGWETNPWTWCISFRRLANGKGLS